MLSYTLIRSRRRTLSLQVKRDGTVVARAPMRAAKRDIERFVEGHADWIRKHQEKMAREAETARAFAFLDGESVPVAGEELILATGGGRAAREGGRLLLPGNADRRAALTAFLREEARAAVTGLIGAWSARMGVSPASVKITSAATRWGSCSGQNRVCFSWRVACLPAGLAEYIVVHELAHIREHNHSPRFWATVAGFLPDFEARRAALRGWQRRIPF